ncbi:MAG: HEPN domain-containing protein, partial [Candidatus Niyogibacteria bacterium]|nr:HEPN domain-containing protein [Candidatus Niyogibacteria bacterium]
MANNPETNYLSWLGKAGEDELSTHAVLKGGGAFSTACFLSQQMAEKYLKGLLVFHNRSFPKVHDLLELETLLLDIEPGVKDYESDLD